MVFATGRFADDLGISPTQTAEVHSQGDACQTGGRRRATAFADGDVVRDAKRQGDDRLIGGLAAPRGRCSG